jgi:hypothetical protein
MDRLAPDLLSHHELNVSEPLVGVEAALGLGGRYSLVLRMGTESTLFAMTLDHHSSRPRECIFSGCRRGNAVGG